LGGYLPLVDQEYGVAFLDSFEAVGDYDKGFLATEVVNAVRKHFSVMSSKALVASSETNKSAS
jgi:hypothetical protein